MMQGALRDVRILDLSTRLSGAWAARLFADFGGDVIMTSAALDAEPTDDPGTSLMFQYANWNKAWSTRDLSELVDQADVVVTNCLSEAVPEGLEGKVHLSITPHGLRGPWSGFPGNNLTHCARSGWATINRFSGEPPLQLPVYQSGYIAGVAGFIAACAALVRGGSECVDVSELEATALTCSPWAIMGIFIGGESLAYGPNRKRHRGRAGPLWQTADGWINYGFGDWQRWRDALHFLDQPELAEDERYVSAWGRHQQDPAPVRDGLSAASIGKDKWALFHGLAEHRCIAGVVQDARELTECEQLHKRDFLVTVRINEKEVVAPGAISKLSGTPWQLRNPAPRLADDCDFTTSAKLNEERTSDQPLAGIRVLCFTQAWAGTFATEILSLLGADVVQIESVKRPDVWRGAGSPVPPSVRNSEIKQSPLNTNGMYNSVNLNKRAITLDVTDARGKEMFWNMIGNFDVLVDNFSPHVMTNWDVTLESLQERRPDMIFASVSGYGRQGPLAEYPANGATTEPMAGLASIHGYEGDEAMSTGGLIPDPISGYYLAASILAAIHHRKHTGEGQRIDAAMMEAVSLQVGDAILEYGTTGHVRKPSGNRHPHIAPHGIFECANDAWIAVAAENDDAFTALCQCLDKPELFRDERFSSMSARKENEAELEAILSTSFSNSDATTQEKLLQQAGVCAAVCAEFMPIYRDSTPQFSERQFLRPVTHPETGTHLIPVMPWVMHNTRQAEVRHAPCFGEHSEQVFSEELGLDHEEYQALVAAGITGKERLG